MKRSQFKRAMRGKCVCVPWKIWRCSVVTAPITCGFHIRASNLVGWERAPWIRHAFKIVMLERFIYVLYTNILPQSSHRSSVWHQQSYSVHSWNCMKYAEKVYSAMKQIRSLFKMATISQYLCALRKLWNFLWQIPARLKDCVDFKHLPEIQGWCTVPSRLLFKMDLLESVCAFHRILN